MYCNKAMKNIMFISYKCKAQENIEKYEKEMALGSYTGCSISKLKYSSNFQIWIACIILSYLSYTSQSKSNPLEAKMRERERKREGERKN